MSDKEAVIYCRTATRESDVDFQKQRCEQHAIEYGYTVEQVFMDHGFSANAERPELKKLETYIKENPGKTLIVSSYDRLYRNPRQMSKFIKFAENFDCNIEVVNNKNGDLEELDLTFGLKGIMNEYEKEASE